MTTQSRFPALSNLNLRSVGQRVARLDHYYQARFRNRFGPTVKQLARYIPPDAVVFDVGANHGKFAKNFAALHGGSCRGHWSKSWTRSPGLVCRGSWR